MGSAVRSGSFSIMNQDYLGRNIVGSIFLVVKIAKIFRVIVVDLRPNSCVCNNLFSSYVSFKHRSHPFQVSAGGLRLPTSSYQPILILPIYLFNSSVSSPNPSPLLSLHPSPAAQYRLAFIKHQKINTLLFLLPQLLLNISEMCEYVVHRYTQCGCMEIHKKSRCSISYCKVGPGRGETKVATLDIDETCQICIVVDEMNKSDKKYEKVKRAAEKKAQEKGQEKNGGET